MATASIKILRVFGFIITNFLLLVKPCHAFYRVWGFSNLKFDLESDAVLNSKTYAMKEDSNGFRKYPLCHPFLDTELQETAAGEVRFLGFLNHPKVTNPLNAVAFYPDDPECSYEVAPTLIIYLPSDEYINFPIFDLKVLGLEAPKFTTFAQMMPPQTSATGITWKDLRWERYVRPELDLLGAEAEKGFVIQIAPDPDDPTKFQRHTIRAADFPEGFLTTEKSGEVSRQSAQSLLKIQFEDFWERYLRRKYREELPEERIPVKKPRRLRQPRRQNEELLTDFLVKYIQDNPDDPRLEQDYYLEGGLARDKKKALTDNRWKIEPISITKEKTEQQLENPMDKLLGPEISEFPLSNARTAFPIPIQGDFVFKGFSQSSIKEVLKDAFIPQKKGPQAKYLETPQEKVNKPVELTKSRYTNSKSSNLQTDPSKIRAPVNLGLNANNKRPGPPIYEVYTFADAQSNKGIPKLDPIHQFKKEVPYIPALDKADELDIPPLRERPNIPSLDIMPSDQLAPLPNVAELLKNYPTELENLIQFQAIRPQGFESLMDGGRRDVREQNRLATLLEQSQLSNVVRQQRQKASVPSLPSRQVPGSRKNKVKNQESGN